MDQLPGLDSITYSASLVLNRYVIAVTSGIVPPLEKTLPPLCNLLLRVQHTDVPVHKPFVYPEREDKWLKVVEGPLHWTTMPDAEDLNETEKDDVFVSVRNLVAFVVGSREKAHDDRVNEIDTKLRKVLNDPERTPYATEEVDGVLFEYYQIPVDETLGSTMVPTARLGQVTDLIRSDWLYRSHPAFLAKGDQPLITAAFIAGYNKETDKGEIYLAVYRGHTPIGVGGKLRFWGIDFTILQCGVLLRKQRMLTLLDYNFQDLTLMDPDKAMPIMEYPTKTGVKNFIAAAEDSPLGTWHVSLQYNGTEWYRDKHAPDVDATLKARLLNELERFVATEKMNNDVNDEQ